MPYVEGCGNPVQILILFREIIIPWISFLQAKQETGLPIDIEVMDSEQLKLAIEAKVDVLQVGTRNALNYSLLKEIGSLSAGTDSAGPLEAGASCCLSQ
jgi:hypothetical protein